jgi:hypothetical protein
MHAHEGVSLTNQTTEGKSMKHFFFLAAKVNGFFGFDRNTLRAHLRYEDLRLPGLGGNVNVFYKSY